VPCQKQVFSISVARRRETPQLDFLLFYIVITGPFQENNVCCFDERKPSLPSCSASRCFMYLSKRLGVSINVSV